MLIETLQYSKVNITINQVYQLSLYVITLQNDQLLELLPNRCLEQDKYVCSSYLSCAQLRKQMGGFEVLFW